MPSSTLDVRPDAGPSLAALRLRLREHRLYRLVRTRAALRTFVEHHVVCVLDFMSLLKSLQRDLAGCAVPWTPPVDSEAARLVQSIVIDEETDVRADGRVQSHFVWYLEAMDELGADAAPVLALAGELAGGRSLADALRDSALPEPSRAFGLTTAALLERPLHVRTAVFFHGREEIIPEMFLEIVGELEREGLSCPALRAYLERHVEVDAGDHGPQAKRILRRLCGDDPARAREAEEGAGEALLARERLWDAIADAC